jgi:LAGLIDADG endonuclease
MSVTILAVANTPVRSMDLPSYISGYVDGEGCFNVSFCRRAAMRTGWDVRPSFSVSQNDDRQEVLELMLDYFGCGTLRPDRSDKTVKFEVRAIANLVGAVVPHFEAYPLMSAKRRDFEGFAAVCRLVAAGSHLSRPGLRAIVELATVMNASGRRKFTADQILGSQDLKVIVSASSNGGKT